MGQRGTISHRPAARCWSVAFAVSLVNLVAQCVTQ